MERDQLFLLPPGFTDNGRREYCPECAELEGLLAWAPWLRETLEIRYQPIAKPRADLVGLLGPEHQNCPTLVLAEGAPAAPGVAASGGYRFLGSARAIGAYWSHVHGLPWPRGVEG